MKELLIKNGRIIDPSSNTDTIADIVVSNGRIKQIGTSLYSSEATIVDATSQIVSPGFIDLHCHLREPSDIDTETIRSGSQAAAKGGYCTICCMPNTNPPLDNLPMITYIKTVAEKEAQVRVLPIGCITKGRAGKELSEMLAMSGAGVVGFSDDGSFVSSPNLMRRAMEYSASLGLPIIEHCEDADLACGGQINEGIIATSLGLQGIHPIAETIAVARDILLAEMTDARLHIAHISAKGTLELIRLAKKRGVKVTCEVTPHHLTLTEEYALGYNTFAKVSPPLRTQSDINALIEGLVDGTIDAVATDHAPHPDKSKQCEFAVSSFGISGFETSLALLMTLVHQGKITLPMLIAKLTSAPASILQMRIGTLEIGAPADITIFDPHKKWQVKTANFVSKGRNNPLDGQTLTGKVNTTIYGGNIVYQCENNQE